MPRTKVATLLLITAHTVILSYPGKSGNVSDAI